MSITGDRCECSDHYCPEHAHSDHQDRCRNTPVAHVIPQAFPDDLTQVEVMCYPCAMNALENDCVNVEWFEAEKRENLSSDCRTIEEQATDPTRRIE